MMRSTRKRLEALEKVIPSMPIHMSDAAYAGVQEQLNKLRADLNRIGAQVQMLILIPGLQEVEEVPEKIIPAKPAHYELKKR